MSRGTWTYRTVLRACAVSASGVLLLGAVHSSYVQVPVTIDQVTVFIRPGQTVEGVVREHGALTSPNIRAASDGRVVGTQGQVKPIIMRNDVSVSPYSRIAWGDEIAVRTPPDVVESSRIETRAVEIAPRTIGRGVTAKTVIPGVIGVEQVTVGAVSGDVLAVEVLTPAQPGITRMIPAAGTPLVALTFDDGPWPQQTEAILTILAERDVPATFFMLGSRVKRMPAVARAMTEAGHVVGNHTYWHVKLDEATPEIAASEILGTSRSISVATGIQPHWFRAPAGRLGGDAHQYIERAGLVSALWTVDPQDWRKGQTAEAIVGSVTAAVNPGAIILLHDGGGDRSATITALPIIIDRLRAMGYEFVTLDELPTVKSAW